MMGILDEIQTEADRAADLWKAKDSSWTLSNWCTFMSTYLGEAFSIRHRSVSTTRVKLVKLGGLVVNCIRQIDAGNLGTHEF